MPTDQPPASIPPAERGAPAPAAAGGGVISQILALAQDLRAHNWALAFRDALQLLQTVADEINNVNPPPGPIMAGAAPPKATSVADRLEALAGEHKAQGATAGAGGGLFQKLLPLIIEALLSILHKQ